MLTHVSLIIIRMSLSAVCTLVRRMEKEATSNHLLVFYSIFNFLLLFAFRTPPDSRTD